VKDQIVSLFVNQQSALVMASKGEKFV